MSEENKIYVIKYRGYWYDDEYYSPRDWGCSMCHLFYNKEEAIEQWKILENDFLMQHDYDILDYEEANSDLSQLNLDHLNPQIKEKLLYTLRYDEILDFLHKSKNDQSIDRFSRLRIDYFLPI